MAATAVSLESEIRAALDPVEKLRNQYAGATKTIGTRLLEYFAKTCPEGDSREGNMAALNLCLKDRSLDMAAFDQEIQGCFRYLQKTDGIYEVSSVDELTPEYRKWYDQLAYALSILRIALGLECFFAGILEHPLLDLQEVTMLLERARSLKEDAASMLPCALPRGYYDCTKLRQDLVAAFHTVYPDKLSIAKVQIDYTESLNSIMDAATRCIEAAYRAYPNVTRISWVLWDAEWQTVLKTCASSLFGKDFVTSAYKGTMTIREDFAKARLTELNDLFLVVYKTIPAHRTALLKRALVINAEGESELLGLSAPEKADLAWTPSSSVPNQYVLWHQCEARVTGGNQPSNQEYSCSP